MIFLHMMEKQRHDKKGAGSCGHLLLHSSYWFYCRSHRNRAIHPGDDKAGFIVTTFTGDCRFTLATYGGRLLGLYSEGSAAGFIVQLLEPLLFYSSTTWSPKT